MSAIAGIYTFNADRVCIEHGNQLMKDFENFPSDYIGRWNNNNVFFGCHAQCITPESLNEWLPYWDSERQLAITADAMIDNRNELFERLQVNQLNGKTISDSELILLAYVKWGKEVPKYLIGDYAFMIWDERKNSLFGARDFSGSRTLYYYKDHEHFVFSTLIESLFRLPIVNRKINENWLAEFLAIPTIVESADMHHTVYESVYQLPPGYKVIIENGQVKLERYWYVGSIEPLNLKSDSEYQEAFHEVFHRSVTEKMRTYGKVGSHLSGGLDSGSVVSFAAKNLIKPLHTYSYIPEETFKDWTPKYYKADERPFIKETVRYVGNIEDHYLDFKGENPYSGIDEFLEIMEMPYKFFENAFWLNGINKKAQSDGVKIILNGARGNHSISWGSERLNLDYYASLLKSMKLLQLNRELDDYCSTFRTGKKIMLPIVARNAFPNIFRSILLQRVSDNQFPTFINPALARKTNVYEKLKQFGVGLAGGVQGGLDEYRRNYYDQLYIWNKSGTATTKLSLRYSLWDRDPTNDPRVIRFCLAIPEKQYVQQGMERSFLRRVTKNMLPEKVRLNHHIRGIQAADTIHRMKPVWQEFIEEIEVLYRDPTMGEILDMKVFKEAMEHVKGQLHPNLVWMDEFKVLTRSLIVYRFLKTKL